MTILIILLIVGLAAVAVLLACFRGFSRALRHKMAAGVYFRVEETGRRKPQGPSKTLVDFAPGKSKRFNDPASRRISSGTAALVSLAIVLASRGVPGDARAASFKSRHERDPKLQREEKTQVHGVQPLHSS
jgi:hypothetical protein